MKTLNKQFVGQSKLKAWIYSFVIFVVTIVIAFYVYSSQTKILNQILERQGNRVQTQIVNNVGDLMADLTAMAKRWVNAPETTEINWRDDAGDLSERIPGINSVWMIDKEFNCLWIVSDSIQSANRCQQMMNDAGRIDKMNSIKERQNLDFSKVYKVDGDEAIYMFQPLGQDQLFDGFIVLEFKFPVYIDYLLGDPTYTGYYTKAYADMEVVFANGPELTNDSYLHFFELDMDADEGSWVFKVYPTEVMLDLIITYLPYYIVLTGAIIALLFLLTLLSKHKAKDESNKLATEINKKEKAQFELEYLANHDTLTHLPNRHYITKFIEKKVGLSKSSAQRFTLLFVDLDHFKDINDTLGHAIGDKMLKKLPVLFNKVFRHDDVIARMGGDEFVVYLPGEMSESHVVALLQRFLKSLEYPIQIDEHLIRLTGSVGVAFYPQHGSNVTELLSHADAALYRAKDQGRNTFAIYDSEIEQIAKDRINLIAQLHLANENNEFEMYFQPRYNIHNSQVIGAEALMRWNAADKGVVKPAGFLNLLEDTSLIIPISYRMLTQSCELFLKALEIQPNLFLSFNISAKLLEHPEFLSRIKLILAETHFPAEQLEFELTEQILIQNVENSQYILAEVKQLGISIAIDDFGTGYSSLSYLKNFPVDVLKIDKSFIVDIDSDSDDLELVKTMLTMGKNLNITTVAEGVENEAQLLLLKQELCDQIQGYYFNKPMKFYDFYQLVTT